MRTDRELLELAAKAAGIKLHVWGTEGSENFADMDAGPYGKLWDPLTDDGDALRLAVNLQLNVNNEHVSAGAAYCTRGEDEVFHSASSGMECHGPAADYVIPEDYDATRRAIVLAAAEIGASMP